ncbi:G/T mismatch-specific thymine DNA glycosylase-like [Haliotis cracherodii]|uniref:G/T mismatch-specific thymine DNA glycosylase-like n=1 Tax=Haliotis cracherodii TaxID=6455 RepID=UPI0039EB41C2
MDESVPIFTPAQFQLPAGFQQLPDSMPIKQEPQEPQPVLDLQPPAKAKAKKKKIKKEPQDKTQVVEGEDGKAPKKKLKQEKITEHLTVKKKRDRFNGMPEEEVVLRLLPDHLIENLDIVIVGINPGLFAAYVGHHYAGPGNHFWKCLYLSGLIPEPMNAYQDHELQNFGIGFTNICARTTRGSADLKRTEIKEGATILREKLQKYKPKIAAFNGKGIYEVYCGHKNFILGKQPEPVEGTNTMVYVMPSSSARCAQLPRAVDKVPFYLALKKLRDHCRGDQPILDESEVCFPNLELKIKTEPKVELDADGNPIKTEPKPKAEPKSKSKSKKSKAQSQSQTSQSQNIPVPTSHGQMANGMWSAVKQEKPYDPSEYGGQPYGTPISAACAVPMSTQMMPVYQNAHIYSQPNGQSSAQGQVTIHNGTKSTSQDDMGRTLPSTTAVFYPASAQPMYQGQMYSQGSFLQQLQEPNLTNDRNSQTWQYPSFSANEMLDNSSANKTTEDNASSQVVQIKTEPEDYGYTEIPFNSM